MRATKTMLRWAGLSKDALMRLTGYAGIANTLLLVGLLAPALYGSETINGVLPLARTLTFPVFTALLYALCAALALVLLWIDLRFLRGVEHARSNSFQPFAVQPALNAAQHLAELERAGFAIEPMVARLTLDAERLGCRDEFVRSLAAFRAHPGGAPRGA